MPATDTSTRSRILEGALEVFAERGFAGARTRDIAEAARVNLGLLQYYFGGKEKLWQAAVDHAFAELWSALGARGPGTVDDAATLAALVAVAVRFAASHPALVRVMNDEGKRSGPRLRWLVDRHGRRLYDEFRRVLESPALRSRLGDVDPIHFYYVFIGATGLIFSQAAECKRLSGTDPTASPAMIDAHARLVVRLLLGDDAA